MARRSRRTLPGSILVRLPQVLDRLWFVPSVIVIGLAVLAVGLVRIDHGAAPGGSLVFGGDAGAARTVMATIAGSLVSVAGLTFSVTVVVLQLASSQFSPRLLPNFLGDRVTQVTVGVFVGVFVYALIALRSVSADEVPRLSVTVGSVLGALALILLIFFIDHISRLIQVSESARNIGRRTLREIDTLYPESYGEPEEVDPDGLLARWHEEAQPGAVRTETPGYVARVQLDELTRALPDVDRFVLCVCPGDAVSTDMPLALVWPRERVDEIAAAVHGGIVISGERTLAQDAGFGFRQLTDIALRAISPGINDPTTAVTCVLYLRSALTRLAGKRFPEAVRRLEGAETLAIVRRREFGEYVRSLVEIGRYAGGDARVVRSLLEALRGVAASAAEAGALDRAQVAVDSAEEIAEPALERAGTTRDRDEIADLLRAVGASAR
jgi:uncharacterized membrane protein